MLASLLDTMQSRRSTNLSLIGIVLLAGIALGWLLRDLLFADRQPTTATQPPTVVAMLPSEAPTSAPTLVPTEAPTLAPTEAPTQAPTAVPTQAPTPNPTAIPTEAPTAAATTAPTAMPPATGEVAGYIGHTVAEGETLAGIAQAAGSTPDIIARYNLLAGEPLPGRELIIPQLAGQPATLVSASLLVERGRADQPWVALTLDAGAGSEPVVSMLKTLRERNIRLTFFLTGKWIRENPDLTRQIVADGHEIANHTVNHPDLRTVSDEQIRAELRETEALLHEVAGENVTIRPFFRPPYGAYDERVLDVVQDEGYMSIYWTLDSLDSVGEPKTAAFLLERVTAKLSPEKLRGAIILAHCGSAPTAEALPAILDRFAEMGFEVKKLSEVL